MLRSVQSSVRVYGIPICKIDMREWGRNIVFIGQEIAEPEVRALYVLAKSMTNGRVFLAGKR